MGARHRLPVGALSVLAALVLCAPAAAATIDVTTDADGFTADGQCSLREAISEANGSPQTGECTPGSPTGTDTIVLPAGLYKLTSSTSDDTNAFGDLDIASDVALVGAGSATTTIDAQQQDRVIDIRSGNVTISGATITGGKAKDGSSPFSANSGGGIRHSAGSLTLSGVAVTGNVAGNGTAGSFSSSGTATNGGYGGFGGGLYSNGQDLTITGSTFSNNTAGAGGNGGGTGTGTAGNAGGGGRGGGISVEAGAVDSNLTITDTTISGNTAGAGGAGGSASTNAGTATSGGFGGGGGGISASLPSNGNTAHYSGLTITGNVAGAGGTSSVVGGTGGSGGGAVFAGSIVLNDSTISGNHAGAGGPGANASNAPGGPGGSGGGLTAGDTITLARLTVSGNFSGAGGAPSGNGGQGGGLYLGGLSASLSASTISGNKTGDGAASSTVAAGQGGNGGGIYAANPFTFTNSTVANNTTGAGGDYTGPNCPNWAYGSLSGAAAGLFMNQYDATLTHVTIAGNSTGPGGSGLCNGTPVSQSPSPRGGIDMSGAGTLTLSNSVIASNNPNNTANCYVDFGGTIADGGGNVKFPHDYNDACPGVEADPKLGPLANNGGPTQTMALLAGSSAIDIGVTAKCLPADQRGTSRPQGSACDAGAFELEQAPVTNTQTNTQTSTSPTPTVTTESPTPGTGAVADTTAPIVKLLLTKQRLLKALKKGYVVGFSSNEPGAASATLFVKKTRVASGRLTATSAGKLRLVAKFTRKAKKALAKQRKATLRLVLVMRDNAGNRTQRASKIILKR